MKNQLSNNQLNKPTIAMTTENMNTLQLLLVAYIEEGNWIRLKGSIAIEFFADAASSLRNDPALCGAKILHIVLCNDPPVDIIDGLIQKFPETPFLSDSVGRYTLHIASSAGLSSKIVAAVARAHPQACMKQDLDGRTPLHFACDASRLLYEEDMLHHPHNL